MRRRGGTLAVAAAGVVACLGAVEASAADAVHPPLVKAQTCFWSGPYNSEQNNFAYPDAGASYWFASFRLPEGAKLVLQGDFPHARYTSLNVYRENGSPSDSLPDTSIRADAGSTNPFLPGAKRGAKRRAFTVDVLREDPPPAPAAQLANTLYTSADGSTKTLALRVYVPDRGRDITGGVGLPTIEMHLADGTVVSEASFCANGFQSEPLPNSSMPLNAYLDVRDQDGKPPTFPALDPPRWDAAYNSQYGFDCTWYAQCGGSPDREVGQYANLDNAYVAAYANRGFGKVLFIRGKLPTTPETLSGNKRMGVGQLRYWSLCANEGAATTMVTDCLFDEQLELSKGRRFAIAVTRPGDRPDNLKRRCGYDWLPWPERGDGAGHRDDAYLILRNMLPAGDFENAIQNTATPGDEKAVMRAYYPSSSYSTVREFEDRGCKR